MQFAVYLLWLNSVCGLVSRVPALLKLCTYCTWNTCICTHLVTVDRISCLHMFSFGQSSHALLCCCWYFTAVYWVHFYQKEEQLHRADWQTEVSAQHAGGYYASKATGIFSRQTSQSLSNECDVFCSACNSSVYRTYIYLWQRSICFELQFTENLQLFKVWYL